MKNKALAQMTMMLFGVGAIVASIALIDTLWMLLLGIPCCLLIVGVSLLARDYRTIALASVVVAVFVSIVIFQWPLRAAFSMSRPTFEQIAGELQQGKVVQMPRRVGAYRILKTEVDDNDVVCLWTDLNPSGKAGFVQCAPENPPFNIWSHVMIDDAWQFIRED